MIIVTVSCGVYTLNTWQVIFRQWWTNKILNNELEVTSNDIIKINAGVTQAPILGTQLLMYSYDIKISIVHILSNTAGK